jgi:hypothetical protein
VNFTVGTAAVPAAASASHRQYRPLEPRSARSDRQLLYQRLMPDNQEPIARYVGSVDRATRFHKDALGVSAQLSASFLRIISCLAAVIECKDPVTT